MRCSSSKLYRDSRHGESTSDLEPRRIEGTADFPLTDRGHLQFLEQFARAADLWFSLCHGADHRTVGIVTHGGTIQALYRAALGLSVDTPHYFLNGDTCVHEWWVEPGGGSVKVLKANCTYHLRSLTGV